VVGLGLFVFLSGHALTIGLGCAGFGTVIGLRWARVGVLLVLVGLVLALASAVPLPNSLYLLLIGAVCAWVVAIRRSHPARYVSAGLLVATCLALLIAGFVVRPAVSGPLGAAPVFVLGDSLSAGVGADRSATWPALLAVQTGGVVENLAHPGARLLDGIPQAAAIPQGSSTVLVELGGNDLLAGVDPGTFEESLRRLLHEIRQPDRTVVMLELPLLPSQNRYGRAQWQACGDLGVALIPRRVLAGALALPSHTTDGLHLSPQGHRWLARRIGAWF
jgi:acyl-CoA thioesterase-1